MAEQIPLKAGHASVSSLEGREGETSSLEGGVTLRKEFRRKSDGGCDFDIFSKVIVTERLHPSSVI